MNSMCLQNTFIVIHSSHWHTCCQWGLTGLCLRPMRCLLTIYSRDNNTAAFMNSSVLENSYYCGRAMRFFFLRLLSETISFFGRSRVLMFWTTTALLLKTWIINSLQMRSVGSYFMNSSMSWVENCMYNVYDLHRHHYFIFLPYSSQTDCAVV